MDQDFIINITEQAMLLVLILSMPPILIATCVGLMTSLLQALTQIQEQTLSFAIKLFFTVLVLSLSAYWIGGQLMAFANFLFTAFATIIR
ncbi:MAG: type III secretion system export apparatus subunit SctS [Opitutales bacterium]|nr:type III secretion system export apparatus subunit SctS [Opitutales bacterium]